MTTEYAKALLRKPEEDIIPSEEDSVLGKIENGHPDTLGKKLLNLTDLDGVERIGEEEIVDLTNGALTQEGLGGVRRVGIEAESSLSGNLGTACKDNPDDDVTVGSALRNDTTEKLITAGRIEEPTDMVVNFKQQ